MDIDVHGGLTYSANTEDFPIPKKDNGTWFGFDCGHYGDASDWDALKDLAETDEEVENVRRMKDMMSTMSDGKVCTTEYVIEECEKLAHQLERV